MCSVFVNTPGICGESIDSMATGDVALRRFLWPVAQQRLVTREGREVGPDELGDRVVAVTFFDTGCSILCVDRLAALTAVADGLPSAERGHVAVLAVSVDPAADAPPALDAFAKGVKLDAGALTLLSGEARATQAVMASIGWRPGAGSPDRAPPTVFVFDRKGAFAMRYAGAPLDRRRLAQDLTTLADLASGVGGNVAPLTSLR